VSFLGHQSNGLQFFRGIDKALVSSGNIVINQKQMVMIIARKYIERVISIGAKLDAPLLRGDHVVD